MKWCYFFLILNLILFDDTEVTENPCEPSPCGPNSACRRFGDQASCTCLPGYFGVPPTCRPECIVSSDCEQSKSCINEKCDNPCTNSCGQNALCNVRNHNPICSCPERYDGDPFIYCFPSSKSMEKLTNLWWQYFSTFYNFWGFFNF